MVKVHVVGERGGGGGTVAAVRHLGSVQSSTGQDLKPDAGYLWQPEDKKIEDQPEAGHAQKCRVVGSRVNLSMVANYNNAIVITAEGNLSATGPETEGGLSATRSKIDELLFTQPTDHPNKC